MNQYKHYLAETIARISHEGQTRRDGITPYIKHPEMVVEKLGPDSTEDQKSVAWLHDVLEDTDATSEDLLEQGISHDVVTAVEILTKTKNQPYVEYLEAVAQNDLARTVKIADMLANLSDTPTDRQILKYAKGLQYLMEYDTTK